MDWPLQWGGAPDHYEKIVDSLFASVGKGHAADFDGVEWLWRRSRGVGLAMLASLSERAFAQFNPRTATDALPYYRQQFTIPDEVSDQLAREQADLAYHAKPNSDVPDLQAELRAIDPRFTILDRDWAQEGTTMFGRAFEPRDGSEPFNLGSGRGETRWPNYSSAFELVVLFDLTVAPTAPIDKSAFQRARAYLDYALPSWNSYVIIGSVGFVLDSSPVDWTGLGE